MIKTITFEEILPIWTNDLWPNRQSAVEATSAMCLSGNHDIDNMKFVPTFFAYIIHNEIAGVNSGHMCKDLEYRSRGLFVFDKFRGRGIGTMLLKATIEKAKEEGAVLCWSYPRDTSWKTYMNAGFRLVSEFELSETGNNAYCVIDL
jgi:GNAT superfamily N-acetyltransferase